MQIQASSSARRLSTPGAGPLRGPMNVDQRPGLAEDQTLHVLGTEEGVREAEADRRRLRKSVELFFREFVPEAGQVVAGLLLGARPDDRNYETRLLPHPVDSHLGGRTARVLRDRHDLARECLLRLGRVARVTARPAVLREV